MKFVRRYAASEQQFEHVGEVAVLRAGGHSAASGA
jgi:hypothetical protein